MEHIEKNLRAIRRRIMVRVWYSYLITMTTNSAALVGLVLGASLALFFKLVSVSSILHNLLEVRLGSVPEYIWSTLTRTAASGEFLKLISLTLIIVSLLYLKSLLRKITFDSNLTQSA